MSRIDELIAEHCPIGVGYASVSEVFSTVPTPRGIKRSAYSDGSKIAIVDQGQTLVAGYTDDDSLTLPESQYVVFGDHTRAVKWIDFPFAVGADGTKVLKTKPGILPKFGYYALSNLPIADRGYNRHWSVVRDLKIPVPPLEIQREIVWILDTFSKMEAELEAELEARKQQYDHYLRKLTEPFEKDGQLKVGWNAAKIGQLCQLEKGTTPIQKATPGQYPLVVTAAERRSSSEYQFDSPASCVPLVSSKGHGVASISKVYFQDGKFALGNILCAIIPNDPRELSAEFITYFLQSRKDFLLVPLMRGGANVSLTVDSLRKVMICFPPREEQDRIVSVFRVLESLQDHEAYSLPAELSARRQQYEYYRDKLLTFKELEAAS